MPDLSTLLDNLVAFSRHIRAQGTLNRVDLARLEYFHQILTYHVMHGERKGPEIIPVENASTVDLIARRCSIEGCWGGPKLWNIAAGRPGREPIWRCLAHIPPDITFPVSLHGDEWKATGRK